MPPTVSARSPPERARDRACRASGRSALAAACSRRAHTPASRADRAQELYLAFNDISQLSPLTEADELQVLDLEANAISDMEQVEFLQFVPSLQELTLRGNAVCDGAPDVRERVFAMLPSLELLDDELFEDLLLFELFEDLVDFVLLLDWQKIKHLLDFELLLNQLVALASLGVAATTPAVAIEAPMTAACVILIYCIVSSPSL